MGSELDPTITTPTWRAWADRAFTPSLVRRLLVAQLATLALLWALILSYVMYATLDTPALFDEGGRVDAILALTHALRDRPAQLHDVLEKWDRMQRFDSADEDREETRMSMAVWRGDAVVYSTPGRPGVLPPGPDGAVVRRQAHGLQWTLLSRSDASGEFRVVLARRMPGVLLLVASSAGHASYLTPLILTLPLLFLPAWFAVRSAVAPLVKLGAELAEREPGQLAPLQTHVRQRELRPLVEAVNAWLGRMRSSQQRENTFVANAAHELRTPLTVMRLSAETLRRNDHSPADRELIDLLIRGCQRGTRLVEQLLALLRNDSIAAQHRDMGMIPLRRMLETRMSDLHVLAEQARITLALHAPAEVTVQGHAELLQSVIDNLIGNAIKYSPAGSTVQIDLSSDGAAALLSCTDQGPGIAPSLRRQMLERFQRGGDAGGVQGSGLGLAIAHAATLAHHGSLRLDCANPTYGLQVTARLPLRQPCKRNATARAR